MSATPNDEDYVLGVNAAELARLGLQHRAWRKHALAAWERAQLRPGMQVIDAGCGPGFATLDLAEQMEGAGKILAFDRSSEFLQHLDIRAHERGFGLIETLQGDVTKDALPLEFADRIWSRWMLIFVEDLDAALDNLIGALRPGGRLVLQEYLDYRAWNMLPESAPFNQFREAVMASWDRFGGDANVGTRLHAAFAKRGMRVLYAQPVVYLISPEDPLWRWPGSFEQTGPDRLVELGLLSIEEAKAIRADWERASLDPQSRMLTPIQIEMVIEKPVAAS